LATDDDINLGLSHTQHLIDVDRVIDPDPQLIMLHEVFAISDRESGIGGLVRDARILRDGHYYLPAFSIPYVGRQIAFANHEMFTSMFEKAYAENLGDMKARLLLRYGLMMQTPSPQNIFIQLDRDLKPTGKMVLIDLSDTDYVEPVAHAFGFDDAMRQDVANGNPPRKSLDPLWAHSQLKLNESGLQSVPEFVLDQWGRVHDQAFVGALERALGVAIPGAQDVQTNPSLAFARMYQYLESPQGQQRLRLYRSRVTRPK
jgi:hypothetical protein